MHKIRWWDWLPVFGWRIVAEVDSADEVPVRLPRNGVILVGPQAKPKWLAFDCPCRTGHRILLNADRTRRPYWSIAGSGRLSIMPSVDYHDAHKRCHYFIRNGHIAWARADQ